MGTTILNDEDKPVITRPDIDEKAHKGEMFFVSNVYTVAAGATVYFRHKGTGYHYLHSIIDANSTGEWDLKSYSGTTYTNDGTEKEPINRKSDSTYEPTTKFYINPVIDVLGDERLYIKFGSGTNPSQGTTGSFSEVIRSVFDPNADVLIAFTNNTNGEQSLTVLLNAFEEVES